MNVEEAILVGLLNDDDYVRQALPFLKPEYFDDPGEKQRRVVFDIISGFIEKYKKRPTPGALAVELGEMKGLTDDTFQGAIKLFEKICTEPYTAERQWLLDRTEDWCKRRAVYLGIQETIAIQRGESKLTIDSIPDIWREAISINFKPRLGHDYIEDAEQRFLESRNPALRLPFEIPILNRITKGGFLPGTVNLFVASTHVGKTFVMCNLAAAHMMMGKNVLYLTLEMSETQIGQRIDANLLDIDIHDLDTVPFETLTTRMANVKRRVLGRLVIEQFPTAAGNVNHFRAFIDGLRLHKNFVPDVIYVDYLNLCTSVRTRSDSGSYFYVKSIIEELRGMGIEIGVPIITATQTNKGAHGATDFDLDSISESWGVAQTADFALALIATDELREKNQMQGLQLKNRYANMHGKYKRFLLGTDFPHMRLYQLDESAQIGLNRGFQGFVSPQDRSGKLDFSGVQ